jgi:hypothetical protein
MAAEELGTVDFSTFIVSLASNVMMHLGEGPAESGAQVSLGLAQQTIDIIAMLEEKTAGNRTEDEEKLVKGVLYQVRMAYVSRTQ